MARWYLIDTNHMSEAVRRVSVVRDRILREARAGVRFGTCIPVLLELEAGIQRTARPAANHRRRDALLRTVRLWPVDASLIVSFGQLAVQLEDMGRSMSHVDKILAVLARTMDLTVLTADRDFEALADIRTENWVAG
jgi:predicted nucleic acid-binding protein